MLDFAFTWRQKKKKKKLDWPHLTRKTAWDGKIGGCTKRMKQGGRKERWEKDTNRKTVLFVLYIVSRLSG